MKSILFSAALAGGAIAACSSSTPTNADADAEAPGLEAGTDAPPSAIDAADAADAREAETLKPTGQCASTFGSALTPGFGRIDGVVYAVQKPSDTACVLPNSDHVVLQVLMNNAVYRLVVNVQGSGTDSKIRFAIAAHALPAPAFAEGWHVGAGLDYATTLDAHAGDTFTPLTMDELVPQIAAELKIGNPVSVYGTSGAGRPDSAHLIHRNKTNEDGAIVLDPKTTPRFMLFHFANQAF